MHYFGVKLCNASPTAASASTVRAAMRRRIDLIFEKGLSIPTGHVTYRRHCRLLRRHLPRLTKDSQHCPAFPRLRT